MYTEILSHIRTKSDVWQLEGEVDLLLDKLYKADEAAFTLSLEKDVREWVSQELSREFVKGETKKDEFLRGLKVALGKLRVLNLTLAFDPTLHSIEKIHDWVRRNIGEGIILEIAVNPTLFAGAILVYKGEYRDFTFRNKFRQDFNQNREEIFKILSKNQ